jgi:hypothetical protein
LRERRVAALDDEDLLRGEEHEHVVGGLKIVRDEVVYLLE